jgi:sugar phosphate isomerase/epimerase
MRLILHSVSYTGAWPGQAALGLEEFIPRAAGLGYEGVMLAAKRPHLSLLDYPPDRPERRKALRALAEAHGLRIDCLAAYTDFAAGLDRPDLPHWEHQAGYVAGLAGLARDLGCPLIRVFTGYERPGLPDGLAWERTVSALRECARQVERFGVTLAVQNHHDLAAHHESLHQLLTEVDHPRCRAAFDAWAPVLQGLNGAGRAAAGRRLAPFLAHTTVADYAPLPRYRYRPDLVNYVAEPARMLAVPLGEGIIDYAAFFAALAEVGYTGAAAYEICSPLRDYMGRLRPGHGR